MTVPPSPSPNERPRLVEGQPPPEQSPPEQTRAAPAAPARAYVAGIITAGLSALCSAVFTSWAGVQGTLIGAMVGATVGSSVSEILRAPLTTFEQRIIAGGVSARRLRRDGLMKTMLSSPTAAREALRCMLAPRVLATVAAVALVGFAVAMSGITAVEATAGKPLAAIVADRPVTGTTLGHVLPTPPPALAPEPLVTGNPSTGQSGGGVTDESPAPPGDSAGPGAAPSPGATTTEAAPSENAGIDAVASPVPSESAAGATQATATTQTGTSASSGNPAAVEVVTRVVTVVVTATPTPAGSRPTQQASAPISAPGAPTSASAAMPPQTPTPTPTQTPTATPTPMPSSAL